jgi:leucyl aminopeptidase
MINIDKIITAKNNNSTLIIINKKSINNLNSSFVDDKQIEYIRKSVEENDIKSFSFNLVSHYVFVEIVEENSIEYKTKEVYRRLGGKMLKECDRCFVKDLQITSIDVNKENILAFIEGMMINSYTFDSYKTDPKRLIHPFDNLHVVHKDIDIKDIEQLRIIIEATEKCKDLVNEPVTVINAETLAANFVSMGQEANIKVDVWHKEKIEKEKMGGLLAVNRGSVDPPTFTIMDYCPKDAVNKRPIVLVGKGLVYDTGGLNLKPDDFMNDMKEDMAGAATMACCIYACARLNLPIHIIGLFPSTDNRPCGNAYASGDIINMYDGTNVEVINTDAEGRMILADALAFAKQYNPKLVIEASTLTGAASRAIGPFGIAAIEQDAEDFMQIVKMCGREVYERIAEFPFWDEYNDIIVSDIADIKNCGEKYAGMITAGKFLAYFTSYPFIHLDIAGVAMNEKETDYRGKGATAYGLRLVVECMRKLSKN